MAKFRLFQQLKEKIAAADAKRKSASANAFRTIFALQFLVSFAMLALDLADFALTITSLASPDGFSAINGILLALFHLSTLCFCIAMWAKVNNVANFWTDMSVFSSLMVWVGFSLAIAIANFTNGSSCLAQVISSVQAGNPSQDYQCSGYHLSLSLGYSLTAGWEGLMYFISALIWVRKFHRVRGYDDMDLLQAESQTDAEAPTS